MAFDITTAKPITSKFDITTAKPIEQTQSPKRTMKNYLLPSWASPYLEKTGERTLLGDIFERPGSALRSTILGTGYKKGALEPENVPTYQSKLLDYYYNKMPNIPVVKTLGGFGVSGMGLGLDIATEPANILTTIMGLGITKNLMKSPFMTKPRQISLPKLMNENFVNEQAKHLQTVAKDMDEGIGTLYKNFYKDTKVSEIPINFNKVDESLLRNNVPNSILKEIDETIGKVNTVTKLHDTLNLLGKRISDSAWENVSKASQVTRRVWYELKSLMRESIRPNNPEVAIYLDELDNFASKEVYPKINKFYKIAGRKGEPRTEGIYSILKGGLGKSAQTKSIKQTPQTTKKLMEYFKGQEYSKDIKETVRIAEQLVKNMKKFRQRQLLRKGLGYGILSGIGYKGLRMFMPR